MSAVNQCRGSREPLAKVSAPRFVLLYCLVGKVVRFLIAVDGVDVFPVKEPISTFHFRNSGLLRWTLP